MSTANIVSIEPDPETFELMIPSCVVVFRTHRGDLLSYRYTGYAAIKIMAGDDPAKYFGTAV
jgi:hypothetical protein